MINLLSAIISDLRKSDRLKKLSQEDEESEFDSSFEFESSESSSFDFLFLLSEDKLS
jgi:hypothetical protein